MKIFRKIKKGKGKTKETRETIGPGGKKRGGSFIPDGVNPDEVGYGGGTFPLSEMSNLRKLK